MIAVTARITASWMSALHTEWGLKLDLSVSLGALL
jgi:hypothetical protein